MDMSSKPCTAPAIYIDRSLKPCTNTALQDVQNHSRRLLTDRLTILPADLLIHILSLLPTKDVAAACFSSKTMFRVFPLITTLDFDDSPISYCLQQPCAVERFPTFVAFVSSVLQAHRPQYLTKFRLRVGPTIVGYPYRWSPKHADEKCELGCLPDLNSTIINSWISSALTFCGLRELDLCISIREEGDAQLPPEIFTCETLEVLKLEFNLGLDQVSTMPSFHLPNLKLIEFTAAIILDDGLLTRLVSSCPSLEDLIVESTWEDCHFVSISSPSLRRLSLWVCSKVDEDHKSDFVLFDTPNLEHLVYYDYLASNYWIKPMERLVKADIFTRSFGFCYSLTLSLVRPLSNVQHLIFHGDCVEDLNHDELKHQLPWFHNLKCLELGSGRTGVVGIWDKVLLPFLNCSPVLETLIFPEPLIELSRDSEQCLLEKEFCKTTLATAPSCCKYHLKRIEIRYYTGIEGEIDAIQFLLRHTFVLEELVISGYCYKASVRDAAVVKSTLQNLPRASITCSIQVKE